ncbi:MAG TPA: hypothetical protein VKT27_10290 [Candidatus Binataceae bacterium]|nr:hypothetical protein [Candidatus Binataceae bacterium]
MEHEAAQARGEDKARLILDQVDAIRSRLNAIALQQGLFGGLTLILGAVALVVASAFLLGPLAFLMLGLVVVLATLAGVVRVVRGAWATSASNERAALIADRRAALKGRLSTMVDAARAGERSALWSYLVEDTLALRDEFVAAKIEPRRISRWLWTALASCAIAALVLRFAYRARSAQHAGGGSVAAAPGEPSVDLGDLDIRPADPSNEPGAQIDADPATLQKLAEKLREAQRNGKTGNSSSRLMADARDIASALQNRLTGGRSAAQAWQRLKITDRKGVSGGKHAADEPKSAANDRSAGGSQADAPNAADDQSEPNRSQPNGAATPAMPDMSGQAALNGLNSDAPAPGNSLGQNTPLDARRVPPGGPLGTGGSAHGSGSDPQHLYGDSETPPLGSDTFKIPVEAAPSDDGTSNNAPAPPPTRARTALNAEQAPDEPFERASIPASDRVTIQRVFER